MVHEPHRLGDLEESDSWALICFAAAILTCTLASSATNFANHDRYKLQCGREERGCVPKLATPGMPYLVASSRVLSDKFIRHGFISHLFYPSVPLDRSRS
jgi:hypothetical protein